ncbi:MAG TPA: hypothetical protein VF530_17295 [Planctomycetota bacterium]
MKLLPSLALVLAGLTALAGAATAQNGPVPSITSIPSRKAWAPANLVINGSNLGLAFQVNLDDVSIPIIRATSTRLIAGPLTPREPGFGEVEVVSGRNVGTGVIEFLPTLSAKRRGLRLSIRLNNGEPGTYVLRYSFASVEPVVDPGIYGSRVLPVFANVMMAGIFPDASPLVLNNHNMPIEVGLIGAPLRLQAACYSPSTGVTAYTNLALVAPMGDPAGP